MRSSNKKYVSCVEFGFNVAKVIEQNQQFQHLENILSVFMFYEWVKWEGKRVRFICVYVIIMIEYCYISLDMVSNFLHVK